MSKPVRSCLIALPILAAAAAIAADGPSPKPAGRFTAAAAMTSPRGFHTLTLLSDGRVLAVGGATATGEEPTAETYDAAANAWVRTGPPQYAHTEHAAVRLADGRVLVTGGRLHPASAEIFEPSTGAWKPIRSMSTGRYAHTATLLPDGRVLLAGGFDAGSNRAIASVEIFDPATNRFAAGPSLSVPRSWHTAASLPNGHVLVAGGITDVRGGASVASTEAYDAAIGKWVAGPRMNDARARHGMTVTEQDGRFRLVVAGGCCQQGSGLALTSAEILEPGSTAGWVRAGSLAEHRLEVGIATLADGNVIVAGGESAEMFRNTAERLDVRKGTWSTVPGAIHARAAEMPMLLLPDGSVLISGGTQSDEVYAPTAATARYRP